MELKPQAQPRHTGDALNGAPRATPPERRLAVRARATSVVCAQLGDIFREVCDGTRARDPRRYRIV